MEKSEQRCAGDWIIEGDALKDTGHYEEAVAAYDQAIACDPDNAPVWYQKGCALDELQCYGGDAVCAYSRSLELNPDDTSAWYSLGLALICLEQYEEAVGGAFDLALGLDSTLPRSGIRKAVPLPNCSVTRMRYGRMGGRSNAIRTAPLPG
ncbi:tetratricopeptide repeat protein [Methanogenium cariaci]|uniref:tetratricopeptide repeat protein n=1 Tax=Methanogenium cariaci TaxID=2197 RepID=UPI0007806B2F|nr:tetratricopeptide repeat protein [Methanogenium cariaci]